MNTSNQPFKVVVTAQAFAVSGKESREQLLAAGCEVINARQWGPLSKPDLIKHLCDADAVIAATDPYEADVFAACQNLRLIARCGVGIDSVKLNDATQAGVIVTNVPDAMTDAVADYCIGLLLSLARHIHLGFDCIQQGGWQEFPGVELRGKTLGLVGMGRIGQAVALRAVGFGLRVIAHDPVIAASTEKFDQVEFVTLDRVFEASDIVSIHAPNIPETRNLVNAERLAMMRSGAFLINTARGALVDEEALMKALRSGHLGGAAVDVYKTEPLPADHPIRTTPRLLATPHNAFNSQEAAVRMSRGCAEPILDWLAGRCPASVCNREVLSSPKVAGTLRVP